MQKLDIRKATFLKASSVSEQQRAIFKKILVKEFMSSEESATEMADDSTEHTVLRVRPLSWRSAKAARFFKRLDDRAAKSKPKSRQSVHQTLPRILGHASARPKPLSFPDDFWGFQEDV